MRQLIGKYQFLLVSILLSAIIVVAQNCENVKLSLIQSRASEASSVQANPFGTVDPANQAHYRNKINNTHFLLSDN